jgi:hypothetical protein
MDSTELKADREIDAAANGNLVPDPAPLLPTRRQVYAIAKLLLKRQDLGWPRSRSEAAELITRLHEQGPAP